MRAVEPPALGDSLGFIGPAEHGSLAALRQVGAAPVVITDVAAADLGAFQALIVGSDVLGIQDLRVAASAERLAGFVQAGGRLAFLQLNDQDWPMDLLPIDLLVQEENGTAGDVAAPEHVLFEGVAAIRPAVCYDTLAYADPAWNVLARDDRGGPAIIETVYGKGRILVIAPSFDRWAGEKKEDTGVPESVSRQLLANLLRWCAP